MDKRPDHNHFIFILLLVALFTLSLLAGCVAVSSVYIIEEPFKEDTMEQIRSGLIGKRDILNKLGPPVGLVGPGEELILPYNLDATIAPEPVWEHFGEKHNISPAHLIYYYYFIDASEVGVANDGGVWVMGRSINIHNLWILINAESGRVEDFMITEVEGKLK